MKTPITPKKSLSRKKCYIVVGVWMKTPITPKKRPVKKKVLHNSRYTDKNNDYGT